MADAVSEGAGSEELLRASTPAPSPRRLPSGPPARPAGAGAGADSPPPPGFAAEPSGGSAAGGGPAAEPSGASVASASASAAAAAAGGAAGGGWEAAALAAWQLVLVPLATTARQDPRPRVADAAAGTLFTVRRLKQ